MRCADFQGMWEMASLPEELLKGKNVLIAGIAKHPLSRPRRPWGLGGIFLRALEGKGGGGLMPPGRRHGIAVQRFERDGTQHPMEVGRTQRLQAMPQPIVMPRGSREPWLQPRHQAMLFQPFAYLVKRRVALEKRQHPGCDPTPTREHKRRVGGKEALKHGGHLQAS